MKEPTSGATAADDAFVRREMLQVVLGQTRTAIAGNLAIGLTAAIVLYGSGVQGGVGAWLAALLAVMALRVWHARGLLRRMAALDDVGLASAERQLTTLLLLSSLTWGVLPWIGYTGTNAFVDFFTIAMLLGMTAGAVNSTAPLPWAMSLYIVGALLPFVLKSALIGGLVYLAGGVTIVFSGLVLFAFGRSTYRALRSTLLVTRQNVQLADALRRERDAVQAAMRAKNLFLAGVTHDLRQPVHALGLHLRYLRRLDAGRLQPHLLGPVVDPMDTALKTMSLQLTRLLELSRLEAGEMKAVRRPIAAADVVRTLRAQFETQAQAKGLQLRLRTAPGLEARLDSDPQMLQSILDNLMANAVRYTDEGGVLLALRRRGPALQFRVFDTGPGIAEDLLPQIFIAYRRFDDSRREGDTGQGLGLALAHKQAELLGHALSVRSTPGRGSVFSLSVPLAAEPAPAA